MPLEYETLKDPLLERIEGLRALSFERSAAAKEALALQAKEYERRLDALNHEHERIAANQASSIPREVFDRVIGQHESRMADLERWRATSEGRVWGICLVIGAAVTVINIALHFLK